MLNRQESRLSAEQMSLVAKKTVKLRLLIYLLHPVTVGRVSAENGILKVIHMNGI